MSLGHDHQPRAKVPSPSGPSHARGLQRVNDVREIRHNTDINNTGTLAGDSTWGIIYKERRMAWERGVGLRWGNLCATLRSLYNSRLVNLDRVRCRGGRCIGSIGLRIDESSLDITRQGMRKSSQENGDSAHRASVKKASSTPSLIFAEVSINLIPSSSESWRPSSSVIALLSVQSDLLPTRILFTPSDACCSMLACHVRMSV
jgi:hypothetical protein